MSRARSELENVENARHVRTCQVNKATHSGATVLCNNTKLGGLLTIDFRLVLADFAACYQPVAYQPQQEQHQQQQQQQQLRLLRFAGHLDCDWGRTRFALWHIHKSHLQSSAVCAAKKKCNSAGSGQGKGVISNWMPLGWSCGWVELRQQLCTHTLFRLHGDLPLLPSFMFSFVHFKFSVNFCFTQLPSPS